MKRFLIFAGLLSAIAVPAQAACGSRISTTRVMSGHASPLIEGSGRIARQSRPAGHFTAIRTTGAADIQVTAGAASAIEVETDDNLMGMIGTRVDGDTLVVSTNGSFCTARAPLVRVSIPNLTRAESRGSGDYLIHNLRGGDLSLAGNGSGDFRADGAVTRLQLNLNGSGDAELTSLRAEDVIAQVNGSGDAQLRAERSLDASVSGSGSLAYAGRATQVRTHVGGSGSIARIRD